MFIFKSAKVIFFILLINFCLLPLLTYGREADELEEKQYLQFPVNFNGDKKELLSKLDTIIAIKPISKWSGEALLWKGWIYKGLGNYVEAEQIAMRVLNDYGKFKDPLGPVLFSPPRGWVSSETQKNTIKLIENYPITLEQSAMILLAEIYIKSGKKDKAVHRLKLLIGDKEILKGIKSELKTDEDFKSMEFTQWPQQKALMMLVGIYKKNGDYKIAAETAEEILKYGNYRDMDSAERVLIDCRIRLKEFEKAKYLIEKRLIKLEGKREKEEMEQKLKMVMEGLGN
ncbi:MAG: hypothetical protein L6416_10895 [Candidatus Omnitrophica bacterium]|nr:hypothetical protein [Candidatus Omnitrophota bacterium]